MEDKSPFIPSEATFSSREGDDSDAEKKTDKKKKSKFSELLAKILPKKPETTEDETPESSRVQAMFERFSNSFSSLFGLEKEEVEEPEEEMAQDEIDRRPNVLFAPIGVELEEAAPVIPTRSEVQPAGSDSSEASNDFSLPSVELPQFEAATATPDSEQRGDVTPSSALETDTDNRPSQTEIAVPEEVLIRATNETADSSGGLVSPETTNNPATKTEKETVIETGGGGGAALLGLLVADKLSRSRDEKLKKGADELRRQVQQVERRQTEDTLTVTTAQSRNQEQIDQLRQRRTEGVGATPNIQPATEVAYAKKANREPQNSSEARLSAPRPEVRQSKPERRVPAESVAAETGPITEKSRIVYEQVEKAAEKDVALEGFYERRHEIKDVPSASQQGSSGAGGAQSSGVGPQQAPSQPVPIQSRPNQIGSSQAQQQAYKDAVRQGVAAGLAVVIGFVLLVFIWSLL